MPALNISRPATPDLPPLVFLGPSAPASDVRTLLPDAEIRPPARRGDLYLARLMRYSVVILLDGVFDQEEAVSPREVVDILRDGAAVVGAASMGALRATDCAPAGAEGFGLVARLFRSGVLASEDEVAVVFLPERPFPAMTESLVNIRVALRRAVRQSALEPRVAERLAAAATALPYGARTWRTVFAAAGEEQRFAEAASSLSAVDTKRADVRTALRAVAARLARDPAWGRRPRASRSDLGVLADGRERPHDALLGASATETAPGFLVWMLASGRANRYGRPGKGAIDHLSRLAIGLPGDGPGRLDRLGWQEIAPSPEPAHACHAALLAAVGEAGALDAERYRHIAVARAARAALASAGGVGTAHRAAAEAAMAAGHGFSDWRGLTSVAPPSTRATLEAVRDAWAAAKSHRRSE